MPRVHSTPKSTKTEDLFHQALALNLPTCDSSVQYQEACYTWQMRERYKRFRVSFSSYYRYFFLSVEMVAENPRNVSGGPGSYQRVNSILYSCLRDQNNSKP